MLYLVATLALGQLMRPDDGLHAISRAERLGEVAPSLRTRL